MASKIEILKAKVESIYAAVEEGYVPTAEDISLVMKVEEYEAFGWYEDYLNKYPPGL